jgi:hypothetical protein
MKLKSIAFASCLAAVPGICPALNFNFSGVGLPREVATGLQLAGQRYSDHFSDPITVNVAIKWEPLPGGRVGSTVNEFVEGTYTGIRNHLVSDAKTAADAIAVASLPNSSSIGFLNNLTTRSSQVFLDIDGSANNSQIELTRANAKAMGYTLLPGNDATITLDSGIASFFDFDPSDGVDSNHLDFVGIVQHELGHALGFMSGVDTKTSLVVDENSERLRTLDLFRWSAFTDNGVSQNYRDFTLDSRPKNFSLDGVTLGTDFSKGALLNYQASHWAERNPTLGIMDPSTAGGPLNFSDADLLAFDAIGYDAVPEPFSLIGMGLFALVALKKRK